MHIRPKEIAAWLNERALAANAAGYIVGLSGGIDSAVVAALCQMAMPGRVVGAILPCHSDPQDEADAQLVVEQFSLRAIRLDISPTYDRFVDDLANAAASLRPLAPAVFPGEETDLRARVPLANLKPRLRMAALYYVANSLNYLVAGTGNRCELTIGYFTKYGDGGVDLLPLGGVLKTDVRALARDLGVPDRILEKTPSAGLWPGQSDEAEMGFSYGELERYLTAGPDGVPPALALRIERLERHSEHKRTPPRIPEL